MSEAKYTPGPWIFNRHRGGRDLRLKRDFWEVGGGPDHRGVALVFGPERGGPPTDANALLIAAAPDMLADFKALDALVAERDADGVVALKAPYSWETVARIALDFAAAAIAKVEAGK